MGAIGVVDSASMDATETIAAISTPPGVGAIAIVRVSGPSARSIITKLFSPASDQTDGKWLRAQHAVYGRLHDAQGLVVDEVVVTPFLQPHSYTGEDLIEISCHGSPLVAKQILGLIIDAGARLARQGEFTQRAFLHGRIDLTQAEAVLELIQAKTARQSKNALSILSGGLGREIGSIRTSLLTLLTSITAGIDFPEEVGETPEQDVHAIVTSAILRLSQLAQTARCGKYLREGLKVTIVGRPNAGKSSLLNQLLQQDRAIVSDQPGTTRDSIEELLDIHGLPVILVDTAGIRQTKDEIEQMGMVRTQRAIDDAQVVLHVVDATLGWQSDEDVIAKLIGAKPWFLIRNKIDIFTPGKSYENGAHHFESKVAEIELSAKTGEGMPKLAEQICYFALGEQAQAMEGPTLNERQASLCAQAAADLKLADETVAAGMPQDCVATDLKIAIDRLSEVSGQAVSEELIASVFANFCIGK